MKLFFLLPLLSVTLLAAPSLTELKEPELQKMQNDLLAKEPRYISISDKICLTHAEKFKKALDARLFALGGSFHNAVNEVNLKFNVPTKGAMDLNSARALVITASQDLLSSINENKEIYPFLKNYLFNAANLNYGIGFVDKDFLTHKRPKGEGDLRKISCCLVLRGKISYWVDFGDANDPQTKKIYQESYDHALELVKKENSDLKLEPYPAILIEQTP
ncbi:MAG: hypothetical protein K0S07_158 [Chlamydiales bacterium]|jgi:hypothetical protein|nr:hypothetical protein [Chlamydiales bacterium]